MAAKERKSTVMKNLKDNQVEKSAETPKTKRGRKATSTPNNDNKSSPEPKPSESLMTRKRRSNAQDGRSTPVLKRARRSAVEQEESTAAKTPPPSGQKFKKAHLEKELGDLLENATGRNTPSLPRNKKLNDKEEEGGESVDDKSGLFLPKLRKLNEKETDDDNISVKSFSTLLRTRKNVDKEMDDDVMSVKSMNAKSSRRHDANEDDAASVRSLLRPNLVAKAGRKKKSVLTGIAVKKKIFLKRGRPKKNKELSEAKGKHVEDKRVPRIKVVDKNLAETKQKRIIKKPLKFQSKMKDQSRIRPTIAMKNQKLKKAKLKLTEKSQVTRQAQKGEIEITKEIVVDQANRERLRGESQSVTVVKSDSPEIIKDVDDPLTRRKAGMRKRKVVRKEDGKKDDSETEGNDKPNDVYFFSEGETVSGHESTSKGRGGKLLKHSQAKGKAGRKKEGKKRRESGIHFETTRSPDDSSVMIVRPRLGPKIKAAKRLKPILPKTVELSKCPKLSKDVPTTVLPNTISTTVPNFNQISSSYFVQSIPNFNLFATNSTIIRGFNSNSGVNSNFDPNIPINPRELPFSEDSEVSVSSFGPKVPSNEIIVTPSGIVLSGNRLVSPGNQRSTGVCFNGSGSKFENSNGEVVYSSQENADNVSSPGVVYQSNTTVIQPQSCPNSANTAIFLKRPESMSTSLISTSAGTLLISPSVNSNGGLRVSNVKSHSGCNTSTDTIASEKALEGGFPSSGETSNRFQNSSKMDFIPSIPVAKNVSDLIMLKNKSNVEARVVDKKPATRRACSTGNSVENINSDVPSILKESNSVLAEGKVKVEKNLQRKSRRRTLRNVRHFHGSGSELTFSEPESSCYEKEDVNLFKTISCERINKSTQVLEQSPNVLLQLGSEPITISESLAPFETASMLLVTKKEKLEEKLEKDIMEINDTSPKVKGAIDVCRFSKENEAALREFGLDSDLDQTKSESGDSPEKSTKKEDDTGMSNDVSEVTKKTKIKEEVDNVLREMPIRRISNMYRKTGIYNVTPTRLEVKTPLVLKNNDYLSISPSKPPTVIDKLLERNKSLKAQQESKFAGSAVRNLSENSVSYEVVEVKPRRHGREMRPRKFTKTMESKRTAHKRYVNSSSGCKIYERRGSNPEIYSNNYLTVKNQVANENVPLRRITDPGQDNKPRRSSIDYDSLQKVLDRRCSLPAPAEELTNPKLSKSMTDVNKLKTENIKTIVVGSSKPLTSKNRTSDVQPRVINIVTSNCGYKKGKNLMEEIGLELESAAAAAAAAAAAEEGKTFVNGDKNGRRISMESSNSESENLQKLMDGLTDEKLSNEVPYLNEKNSRRVEKMRLSLERKSTEDKEKKNVVIEESPEDLVTKETILSALGLQSLKAAAQSAQKKKENQNHYNISHSDNGGYTGTLKTVIKIQRQEKKGGSSKSPVKMVYKASSSSSSVSGQLDDSNNFDEGEATSREDAEESTSEDNKNGNGKAKSLVIPEKASSFSIHPGRMCSDVCTYCFGKFGLLDTPCHIAQLKDADKRRNILATEVQLTADSCLCDACFRHVDKKSNCPTFTEKRSDLKRRAVRKQTCIAQNCNADSQHSIRRKLFSKLKKSVGRKVVLDAAKLEKLQPGQSLTFCNRHIYWIDYFMSCGICKKRLTSVNMYRVTSEVLELNAALSADEIPAILTENRYLCKICNCFASIRIKCKNPSEMSPSHRQFYETCRKRILKCHGMEVPDSEPEGDGKNDGKGVKRGQKKSSKPTATVTNENSKEDIDIEVSIDDEMDKGNECEKSEKDLKEVSHMNIPPKANGNLDFGGVSITPSTTEVNPTQIHVKLGNLNIGALGNLNIGQDVRHGARTGDIQCFPTETELALRAHFDLKPSAEDESAKTARKGFEKCTTTIQFSPETKNLFYNLQMPYGNQSSFFRHLILLEKYFRSGDLVISRNADPKAVNYISSVQNRIRSYEGVHNPVKKPLDISPSLSILPQPIKSEPRSNQEVKTSVMPSRPFTLTPMPSNSYSSFLKNSPLSQIQATVQNIQPIVQNPNQGIMTSLLKPSLQPTSKFASHPKPEVSITSVSSDGSPPIRIGQVGKASVLTSKIQENLRNLASKSQIKQPNQARAVILNRTVGGQKQSLVQVTTGGKTIHLTLSQFRRIQQMQMRKKQYLEHQAKMLKVKEDPVKNRTKTVTVGSGGGGGGGSSSSVGVGLVSGGSGGGSSSNSSGAGTSASVANEDGFSLKNLSPELEIQEVKQKTNGTDLIPMISEVRSLAGEDTGSWDGRSDSNECPPLEPSFPKIPKTLSVSVTKIPPPDYSAKEQSVEPVE